MTSELNKAGLDAAAIAIDQHWLDDSEARDYPFPLMKTFYQTEASYQQHCRDTAEAAIRAYLSASHQPHPLAEAEGLEVAAWPLAGYAPGSYMCLCATCGEQFMGDKRAVQCLTCAARSVNTHIKNLQAEVERLQDRIAEIERTNDAEEIDAGLTDNGNLWRFWSRKANDVVVRLMDAKAEVERLRKSRNLWDDQEATTRQRAITAEASLAAARQQIDVLREALGWYASPAAWTMEQLEGSRGDYGDRARAALKGGSNG
jgi:predicted  nucleic acid-binding Zn-ribbon protein